MTNKTETTEQTTPETPAGPAGPVRLIDKACDVTGFASADPERHVLGGVHLREQGVEASDGRIAVRVPYPRIDHTEFPSVADVSSECADVIVPSASLAAALKGVGKQKRGAAPVLSTVRVATATDGTATKIQLTSADLRTSRTTEVKTVDGRYPNVDQVWPTVAPTLTISLAAEYLKLIADYALKHGMGKDFHPVRLEFNSELAVRFKIRLPDGRDVVGVLGPMRTS